MCRLGDLSVGDLLQGVDAGAVGVEGVHEMHGGGSVCVYQYKNGSVRDPSSLWCTSFCSIANRFQNFVARNLQFAGRSREILAFPTARRTVLPPGPTCQLHLVEQAGV